MKNLLQLKVLPREDGKGSMSCRYRVTVEAKGKQEIVVFDSNGRKDELIDWLVKNEKPICEENLPISILDPFQSTCIASTIEGFLGADALDGDAVLDDFTDYVMRHDLGHGMHGIDIPDVYLGKFFGREEISWVNEDGSIDWREVDLTDFFARVHSIKGEDLLD